MGLGVEPFFVAVWAVAAVGLIIFQLTAPPELKAKWHVHAGVCTGLLFAVFVFWVSGLRTLLIVAIPLAAVTYLNIRSVRYCLSCGKSNVDTSLQTPKFCQRCGAPLQ